MGTTLKEQTKLLKKQELRELGGEGSREQGLWTTPTLWAAGGGVGGGGTAWNSPLDRIESKRIRAEPQTVQRSRIRCWRQGAAWGREVTGVSEVPGGTWHQETSGESGYRHSLCLGRLGCPSSTHRASDDHICCRKPAKRPTPTRLSTEGPGAQPGLPGRRGNLFLAAAGAEVHHVLTQVI